MLSSEDQNLIQTHTAGMVATVNDDGTPAVSPKATFVVIDASTIAFGNLRSPNTLANLRQRPQVEVCFIDVIRRRAVRVRGRASVHKRSEAPPGLRHNLKQTGPIYASTCLTTLRLQSQTQLKSTHPRMIMVLPKRH